MSHGYNSNSGGSNFGKGGYNDSPNRFQGAGFYASPGAGDASPGGDSTGGTKKKSGATSHSIVPVTIKQLYSATPALEDNFRIDNQDVGQVEIVGHILTASELSTNLVFRLDDGTGKIDVRLWIDADNTHGFTPQKKAQCVEGAYVKAIGHLRSFNNIRNVVANSIQPLVDFNILTHHFLEVIYVHLQNTKGPLNSAAISNNNDYSTNNNNNNQFNYDAGGYGTDSLYAAIEDLARQSAGGKGIHIDTLYDQLGGAYSVETIKQACEFLLTEGHLFTTLSEDHYGLASQQQQQ